MTEEMVAGARSALECAGKTDGRAASRFRSIRGLPRRLLAVMAIFAAVPCVAAQLPEEHLTAHQTPLRLAVVGDVGLGTKALASGIASLQHDTVIDAILLVGDNIYPRGVRSVDDPRWRVIDPLTSLGLPVFAVLGNHDYVGHVEAEIAATGKIRQWRLPAKNYALHTPLADFAMLDTTPIATGAEKLDGSRRCAVCTALDEAFANAGSHWRIAAGHHPFASSGWHGVFPRSETRRIRRLAPLLRSARVDLYIAGHDHHLELLRSSPPTLISGAGSDPVPPVALHVETVFPTEISLLEPVGFALLEISPTTLRVRFYNSRGRALSDWLTIAKK